jgi:hypothetical protein
MNRIDNSGKGIAGLGRGEDSMLAHVAPGEMVVPPVISPQTQKIIEQEMMAVGLDPNEYRVGEGMSINPITGMAEFGFLKKLGKKLKKVVKKVAPLAVLVPGVGTALGGVLGKAGSLMGFSGTGPVAKFLQTGAKANIPGISPFLSGLTATAPGGIGSFKDAITTGLQNPFGGVFGGRSTTTGGAFVNPLTGATGGVGSQFTQMFGGAKGSQSGGGISLPLLALAGLYGKAVKSDYEKKQGGLQDIRTSIRPDLVPQQTFQGFDMGIRGAKDGGLQELDMRNGGPSVGPGTGTSDDIPAMLSDGEFVMTSAANNGLGGFKVTKTETGIELIPNGSPNRQKGAENMDKLMKTFEQFNKIGQV